MSPKAGANVGASGENDGSNTGDSVASAGDDVVGARVGIIVGLLDCGTSGVPVGSDGLSTDDSWVGRDVVNDIVGLVEDILEASTLGAAVEADGFKTGSSVVTWVGNRVGSLVIGKLVVESIGDMVGLSTFGTRVGWFVI